MVGCIPSVGYVYVPRFKIEATGSMAVAPDLAPILQLSVNLGGMEQCLTHHES